MKKIVLFEGEIETQEYFSFQLKKTFEALGHAVFVHNLDPEFEPASMQALFRFLEKDNTVAVCFNYHGITPGDLFLQDDKWMWDDFKIPVYNIVVDHPYYYHRFIKAAPLLSVHISIDRLHDAYMKRFFPERLRLPFLPLAGTQVPPFPTIPLADFPKGLTPILQDFLLAHPDGEGLSLTENGYLPMKNRPIDIIFTGNYTPTWKFEKYITRLGDEYTQFYRSIIDELIAHPYRTLEDVAEEKLRAQIPEITEEELLETFGNMIFIDLYVRSYFRGMAIKELVDAGLKVVVLGAGWEYLECDHPENIIGGKGVDSITCLKLIGLSKISINVMPWFKDGAHDRIFNTMLNGALCVTDESKYLCEILQDGENCIMYPLSAISEMPERVRALLSKEDELQALADQGYALAKRGHTWENRATLLSSVIEEDLPSQIWSTPL